MRRVSLILLVLFLSCGNADALTVVTEISPPSSYMKDGALTGVGVEIVREMQRRAGDSSPIEVLPWARAYAMAREMPDVALFATTRTQEREALFQWVGPILTIEWLFAGIQGKSPAVSSLEEAKKVRAIGTYRDDAREQFLLAEGFHNLDRAPGSMINLQKLRAGRVDLMATTNLGLKVMADTAGPDDPAICKVFTFKEVSLYVAFSKGTGRPVVRAWQKALDSMKADGTMARIQSNWLGAACSSR